MQNQTVFRSRKSLSVSARILLVLILIVGMLPALSVGAQATNLALNKPVTCSSIENAGTPCASAVDGNPGTRWSSAHGVDPQWIYIDLGQTYTISQVILRWEAAYATAFQIQTSANASTWTTIYSTTTGTGGTQTLNVSGSGRYIRMNGTARALPYGYSLWEFEVFGLGSATNTPTRTNTPSGNPNRALNRPVTCSSIENAGFPCASAVDGNLGTRWASAYSASPQWIYVDLGQTYTIAQVILRWEAAYATSFQIQTSANASTWTTIYSTTTGTGGTQTLNVSGSGRYVRMYATVRALPYGYSLWEFEVYSTGGPTPTPTRTNTPLGPTNTPTRTNTPTPTRTNTPSGASILLSYNKPAIASTSQNNANCSGCTPDKAVDLLNSTRWASDTWNDSQWIYVDLGATATITRVVLTWEAAYGSSYNIQVSPNATSWTTIYSTTTGDGGTDNITGLNGSGRYVRMQGVLRGTAWGWSLWAFDIYGTGGAPNATPTTVPSPTPHGPYTNLVWSDEFNSTSLSTANWNIETGGTGNGNGELQYYTNGQNISFAGGSMIITARQENPSNYQCWYGTCTYTSSRITTAAKREFTYGRIEARIQIPYSQGIWPAFWMLGNNIGSVGWPLCGEIDIMENIGREPNIVHGTVHGPGYSGAAGLGGPYTLPSGAYHDAYHVFAVEWEGNVFRWYMDGILYFTLTRATVETHGQWVFDHPHFILLNVAVGGAWPGSPDGTTVFPQQMKVDYVRVYQ